MKFTKPSSPKTMKLLLGAIGLMLCASAVLAWEVPPPDDFLTGGGWILRNSGAKANFGVGGGTKNGNWWGHLEYIDHGTGLDVHATSITGYSFVDDNTRDVCGFADTNQFGQVAFHLRAADFDKASNQSESGEDTFIIRLGQSGVIVYTTEGDSNHNLGGGGSGGGDIQLHKGNASNTNPPSPPECNI